MQKNRIREEKAPHLPILLQKYLLDHGGQTLSTHGKASTCNILLKPAKGHKIVLKTAAPIPSLNPQRDGITSPLPANAKAICQMELSVKRLAIFIPPLKALHKQGGFQSRGTSACEVVIHNFFAPPEAVSKYREQPALWGCRAPTQTPHATFFPLP